MIINQIVSGGGSAPAYYIECVKTNDNKLDIGSTPLDLTGIADIKDYVLYYAFYKELVSGTNLLPAGNALRNTQDLKTLSGLYCLYDCFQGQRNITGTGLNYLETISGNRALYNTFANCDALTDAGLENVVSITGSRAIDGIFSNCVALETVDFAKLVTVGSGSMSPNAASAPLTGCTKLSNVYFRAVKSTTFSGYLGALQYLVNSTTGSTATNGCTIHFPSNFDPSDPNHTFDASTLTGYPTFNGNADYIHVAFDLPATE